MTEYVWDHRNRLEAEIEKDDMDNILAVVEHSYDYQNRWVRRSFDDDGPGSNDPVDTLWVYDGWQQALEFVNTNTSSDAGPGDLSHVYFWATPLQDYLLADEVKDGSQTSDDVRWAFLDHLGTPRLVVAHLAGWDYAFNERTYDTFGNLLSESDPTYGTAIGFTGKMFDITTGFGYHINRWYDAKVGRWTAEDPIVFLGGDTNLARFVGNATTVFVDPDGLQPAIYFPTADGSTNQAVQNSIGREITELDGAVMQAIAGIAFEPLDWLFSGIEVASEPGNPLSYAGLLPFIPAGVGKAGKVVSRSAKAAKPGTKVVAETVDGIKDISNVAGDVAKVDPPALPAAKPCDHAIAPAKTWTKASPEYIKKTRHEFEKAGGVREQYWMNEFATNRNTYTPQNQALIKNGNAPFGTDGKPMVLHHKTPIEYGGTNDFSNLRPMRYSDHSLAPNFGPLHTPPFLD